MRRYRSLGFAMAALPALLSIAGCYQNVPLGAGRPVPGTRIAVHLTDRGTADLAGMLGPSIGTVEGALSAWTEDTLAVNVSRVRDRRGSDKVWSGEVLAIPVSVVSMVERRVLDRKRTTFLVAGVAAALYTMFLSVDLLGGGSGSSPEDRPNPTPGR